MNDSDDKIIIKSILFADRPLQANRGGFRRGRVRFGTDVREHLHGPGIRSEDYRQSAGARPRQGVPRSGDFPLLPGTPEHNPAH